MRVLLPLAVCGLLAGCGATAPLKPAPGASLPVRPEAATVTPKAEQLMTPTDQARPRRNDELLQDSRERAPDRFDLPPPG
jgi:hypothetical protein